MTAAMGYKAMPAVVKVDQLTESNSVNLLCKVVRVVAAAYKTRSDGSKLRVAEVVVGDDTGTIRLRLCGGTA
jgi:ssDNA-binding replication factor A large subunit